MNAPRRIIKLINKYISLFRYSRDSLLMFLSPY